MARARNIKPSFFDNDELGDLDPLARLLFIGMWTIADYKGELEWREKRVKAQILPYDDCDVKKLAINLDKSGFIRFYSVQGQTYVHVVNFGRHQNPHKNERQKGSEIPGFESEGSQVVDFKGVTINRDKNGTAPDKNETAPADSLFLIPDSLSLIPDSLTPKPSSPTATSKAKPIFEYWCNAMLKDESSCKLTPKREKAILARLKDGYTENQIKRAIDGCRQDPFSMGDNDRQKPFNDIELICRTGEKLESFLAVIDSPPIAQAGNSYADQQRKAKIEARNRELGIGQGSGNFIDGEVIKND